MARRGAFSRHKIPFNFWMILIIGIFALHFVANVLTQLLLVFCAMLDAIKACGNWAIGWISGVTHALAEVTTWQTNWGLITLHITVGCLAGFALGLRVQKPGVTR